MNRVSHSPDIHLYKRLVANQFDSFSRCCCDSFVTERRSKNNTIRAFKDYLNAVNVLAKNRWIMFASRSNRIDGERVESVFIRGVRVIRGGKWGQG